VTDSSSHAAGMLVTCLKEVLFVLSLVPSLQQPLRTVEATSEAIRNRLNVADKMTLSQ